MSQQTTGRTYAHKHERGLDSFTRSARRGTRRRGRKAGAAGAVVKGVVIGASITVLCVAVFALVLSWWDASDRAVTAINQVVKFVSILAAVATAIERGGGALRGCAAGLAYMALGVTVCSLLMGRAPQLTAYLADLCMGVAAGGLFAMILTTRKGSEEKAG